MDYVIENEHIKLTVSDLGAEIQSIFGKKTNFEYLWQGDEKYWKGRAYTLFPICGRLTDGKYTYKGKTYEMNLHGFSRKTVFSLVEKTDDTLTLGLKSDEKSLAIYPFEFDFKVKYSLVGATVHTEYTVNNTGKDKLLFSIGGHPGFNVPLCDGADFSDHCLEFNKKKKVKQLVMSDTCYYTGKKVPFALKDKKILPLKHELFDNDAIFLDKMDDTVTLKCDKGERFVKVHYTGMTHLGFWHAPKTEAPYVCIEPWHGVPAIDKVVDDFSTKLELLKLKPNKTYKTVIDITVNE